MKFITKTIGKIVLVGSMLFASALGSVSAQENSASNFLIDADTLKKFKDLPQTEFDDLKIGSGIGRLNVSPEMKLSLEGLSPSPIPEICKIILYTPDSPWAEICGGRVTFDRDIVTDIGKGGFKFDAIEPSIDFRKLNQKRFDQICQFINCDDNLGGTFCIPPKVYDPVTGLCKNPEVNFCPPGFVYNPITGRCEFTELPPVCPFGYTWNPEKKICEPFIKPQCPPNARWSALVGKCVPLVSILDICKNEEDCNPLLQKPLKPGDISPWIKDGWEFAPFPMGRNNSEVLKRFQELKSNEVIILTD